MSLLHYNFPKNPEDKVEYLKRAISQQTAQLATIQNQETRVETRAQIEKWKEFLRFIESNPTASITIFPMSSSGLGSSANVLISLVIRQGDAVQVQDKALLGRIIQHIYQNDPQKAAEAEFVKTLYPQLFEWWQKGKRKHELELKGLIKVGQLA